MARRQPRNPEGWLLLGVAAGVFAVVDSGLYAVLDYRVQHGRLPLGEIAVIGRGSIGTPLIFCFVLIILLFPDGKLTRRWTWVLRAYLALTLVAIVGFVADEAGTVAGQHIQVDLNGTYSGPGTPAGVLGVLSAASTGVLLIPLFWPAFAARQILSWRRASGLIAFGPPNDQLSGRVVRDLAFAGVAALPVSMGVAILKYHLYDIDRLISRTVSYTLVTGLLIGVYAGLVLLATEVFRFHSAVAVAASTLAVAALFNPLRRRVQRAVDRRFNRARYDAEASVAMFAARLKEAVDLNSVTDDLASVVQHALEPARITVFNLFYHHSIP